MLSDAIHGTASQKCLKTFVVMKKKAPRRNYEKPNDFPMISMNNNLRCCPSCYFFWKMTPRSNHEKTTFRTSLEPQCPRDLPCVNERKQLFRIALTKADQMAAQLCPFHVPRKLRSFSSSCFWECVYFLRFRTTWRIAGKSQLVPFVKDVY